MLSLDKVRKFKKSDFPEFAEFVRRHFHNRYILSDEKFFDWQFKRGPNQNDYSFFLLEYKSVLYGNIGIITLDYKIGNVITKIHTYINLFVDPRVRSLGLGTLLIEKAMQQGSPAFIIAYNPDSYPIYSKLGKWKKLGNFFRYILIFNKDKILDILPERTSRVEKYPRPAQTKGQLSKEVQFEYVQEFDSRFDIFWNLIKGKYLITVQRSSEYLNWRYAHHPFFRYLILVAVKDMQIVGYLIYRIESTNGLSIARIIDFVSQDAYEEALLKKFILDTQEKGVAMIDYMFSGRYHVRTLQLLGFFNVYGMAFENLPMYFNPVSYAKNYINLAVWPGDASIDKKLFYTDDNWYLTKGDSDQDRPNPH